MRLFLAGSLAPLAMSFAMAAGAAPLSAPADIAAFEAAAVGRHGCKVAIAAYLARIEADRRSALPINAYITVAADALDQARRLDAGKQRGPLHCVPVAIKDNIDAAGLPTTAGSRLMLGNVAQTDAEVVARLRAQGAIVLGKANLDEWAHGGAPGGGYSPAGGQTRNPRNPAYAPSGSSGGPAAAVAAGLAVIGIGSDTSGSLRAPAAAVGVVAIKPTVDLVPTTGVVPFSTTTDVVGPLANTVTDAALVLDVLTDSHGRFAQAARMGSLSGARIGIVRSFEGGSVDVDALFAQGLATLARRGAVLIDGLQFDEHLLAVQTEVHLAVIEPEFHHAIDAWLKTHGGAIQSLEQLAKASEGSNPVVLDYLHKESAMSMEDAGYKQASALMRVAYRAEITRLMQANRLDALVFATSSCTARPYVGSKASFACATRPNPHYIASNSGAPQVTVPIGLTLNGLPASLSFLANPGEDAQIIGLAAAYERTR